MSVPSAKPPDEPRETRRTSLKMAFVDVGKAMRDMVGSPRAKPAKKDQHDDKPTLAHESARSSR